MSSFERIEKTKSAPSAASHSPFKQPHKRSVTCCYCDWWTDSICCQGLTSVPQEFRAMARVSCGTDVSHQLHLRKNHRTIYTGWLMSLSEYAIDTANKWQKVQTCWTMSSLEVSSLKQHTVSECVAWWLSGRALDLWFTGRRFNSRLVGFHVT